MALVQTTNEQKQEKEEQDRDRQNLSRSSMVRRLLNAASDLPAFMDDLLTTQAVVVAGTEAAGFLVERGPKREASGESGEGNEDQDSHALAAGPGLKLMKHIRPDNSTQEMREQAVDAFRELVGPCVRGGDDQAIKVSPDGEPQPQYCLVTLLRNEGEVVAASAVITRCADDQKARQRLEGMQLVAGYFDLFMLRRHGEQHRTVAQSHQDVLQLAGAVSTAEGFASAGANLCNELASRLGASRVSLGWVKGRNIKLQAISHTEEFDKKQALSLAMVKAMEECMDQAEVVQFDPDGEHGTHNVTRDAGALSRDEGNTRVVSLPLRRRDEIIGVLLLEFPRQKTATVQETTALAVAADLLAPQLYDRYQNDRYLVTKAGLSVRDTAALAVGPKHMLAKAIIVGAALLLAFVTFYKPMYQIKAPFAFQPVKQRVISAPFEGVIKQVYAKPGDPVEAGAALLEFKTDDLILQKNKAMAQVNSATQRATQLMADDKIAEANVATSEAEEAQAQVDLLGSQIARSVVTAPIAGVVLKGDLEEKEGATVQQGQELFQVAPKQNLMAVLYVGERDVQSLRDGRKGGQPSKGELATQSMPGEKHPFVVDRVIPAAEPRNGGNVFPVHVTLEDPSPSWRPGLEGEARVDVEPKPLIWQWTHRAVEWVRLKLWV